MRDPVYVVVSSVSLLQRIFRLLAPIEAVSLTPGEAMQRMKRTSEGILVCDPWIVKHFGPAFVQVVEQQNHRVLILLTSREVAFDVLSAAYSDRIEVVSTSLVSMDLCVHQFLGGERLIGSDLLLALSHQLRALNRRVQWSALLIFAGQGGSVASFVAICGSGRRTVERQFRNAGMSGVHRLMTACRLARAGLYRNEPESLYSISHLTGFSSARHLQLCCERVLKCSARHALTKLSRADFLNGLVSYMTEGRLGEGAACTRQSRK